MSSKFSKNEAPKIINNSLEICNMSKNMFLNMVLYHGPWPIYFTSIEFMQYGKDLPFENIYWNLIRKWWMEGRMYIVILSLQ